MIIEKGGLAMDVRFAVFDDLSSNNFSGNDAVVSPTAPDYPFQHAHIKKIIRLFIILKNDDLIIIALGPKFYGKTDTSYKFGTESYTNAPNYKHSMLMRTAHKHFDHLAVSGGGRLVIYYPMDQSCAYSPYQAQFSKARSDLGIYDPAILREDVRKRIGEILGLPIKFIWMI